MIIVVAFGSKIICINTKEKTIGVTMNEMNATYPSNVSQAVQLLLYYLPFKDKFEVATKTESELPLLKSSLGKYIQNEFFLDSNLHLIESCLSFSENRAINSEDASLIIIKEFWKQLKAYKDD